MATLQRTRSAVPVDSRSVLATVPGLPWWGSLLISAGFTLVGIVLESGATPGAITTAFFVLGSLAAVLAARNQSLFTPIVMPPLVLACAIPIYAAIHSSAGKSEFMLNVAIPLAHKFPLMLGTFVLVAAIGVLRILWYRKLTAQRRESIKADRKKPAAKRTRVSAASSRTKSEVAALSTKAAEPELHDPAIPATATPVASASARASATGSIPSAAAPDHETVAHSSARRRLADSSEPVRRVRIRGAAPTPDKPSEDSDARQVTSHRAARGSQKAHSRSSAAERPVRRTPGTSERRIDDRPRRTAREALEASKAEPSRARRSDRDPLTRARTLDTPRSERARAENSRPKTSPTPGPDDRYRDPRDRLYGARLHDSQELPRDRLRERGSARGAGAEEPRARRQPSSDLPRLQPRPARPTRPVPRDAGEPRRRRIEWE